MKCISFLYECISYLLHNCPGVYLHTISLQFHFCLAFDFIAYPALFHFHFIPAWLFISLPTQPYFIAISFLPGFFISLPTQPYFIAISYVFHCFPSNISLPFHSYFIACLAIFHCQLTHISLAA